MYLVWICAIFISLSVPVCLSQSQVAFLQGERKGQENMKQDLVRRIKMLEYALKQERWAETQMSFFSSPYNVKPQFSKNKMEHYINEKDKREWIETVSTLLFLLLLFFFNSSALFFCFVDLLLVYLVLFLLWSFFLSLHFTFHFFSFVLLLFYFILLFLLLLCCVCLFCYFCGFVFVSVFLNLFLFVSAFMFCSSFFCSFCTFCCGFV